VVAVAVVVVVVVVVVVALVVASTQAKTTLFGLPVGTSVHFRFRALTPKGQGDWSQPIALIVK